MSLEYSTLDELSSLISDTVVGHMIIRILELYGSFGPVQESFCRSSKLFLPLLPIIVFILANSIVYGLFFDLYFRGSVQFLERLYYLFFYGRWNNLNGFRKSKNKNRFGKL